MTIRFLSRRLLILIPILAACDTQNAEVAPEVDACVTSGSLNSGVRIKDQYIVAFVDDGTTGRLSHERVLRSHSIRADKIIDSFTGSVSIYVLNIDAEKAAMLANDPLVQAVEPDRSISLCACFSLVESRTVPWSVKKVGYGSGAGKTAWLMDTGIDLDHPDLNVDLNLSRSFLNGISSADDHNGHGTHVAGIIGAINNASGILGVASGARLVSLKILDDKGDGLLSSALHALSHIRSHGKAGDVVNISMSLSEVSNLFENEIRDLASRGLYFSIAAGNGAEQAGKFSPGHASGKNIYTISAVDSLNRFASFSNYGNDAVDYAAPGVKVYSTFKDGKYAVMSGTSMAAPHVAGLLLINNGKLNIQGYAVGDPDGVADPLAHQ